MAEETGSGAAELGRGATIGRYLVLTLLGKGGMGEVYAAYDPELDRKVAIKVLHGTPSGGTDAAEGRARMLREAQALAQLSDPNVVAVYDVGTFGERVFLAMEFVDGNTLSYWQQSAIRSWKDIVDRYLAAGRGLAAAHKRGLVHRDFKPENAMVGKDGQVRVMDFGLARSEASSVVEGATDDAAGTPSRRATTLSGARVFGSTPSSSRKSTSGSGSGGPLAPATEISSPSGIKSSNLAAKSGSPAGRKSEGTGAGAPGGNTAGPAAGPTAGPTGGTPLPSSRALALALSDAASDMDGATRDLSKAVGSEISAAMSPTALASPLTQSGAMMGTPAYMAPEQFAGKVADAKSDQFSFCVALYEALYGERPFAGKSLPDLTRQVMLGRVRDVPPNTRVPTWLRKVILRGLRVDRDERHASMEALLAALAADPSRRRRRYLASGSVAGVIAVLTVALIQASQKQKTRCVSADAKLAGVWELPGQHGRAVLSARKDGIRRAFIQTGKRYAADAFALVQSTLDRYVGAWNDMHRDACEATHLRGEQSAEVLDLRMSCLQDRFNEVRALTNVFADANGDVVSKAAEAVQSLRSVEQCADIAALKAVVRPPDNPAVRRAVEDTRVALAEVKALGDAGKMKQAAARIEKVVEAAKATGYEPLMAEAQLQSALLATLSGNFKAAESNYESAVWLAESSRYDEVTLLASAQLVFIVGYAGSRYPEGERWSQLAGAVLRRAGPGHDVAAGWLANNRGMLHVRRGALDEALRYSLEAIKVKERAYGPDHVDVAISENNVAEVLLSLGRVDEAIQRNDHAVTITVAALGSDHPRVASLLETRADLKNAKGQYGEARTAAESALEIASREFGWEHYTVRYALVALGKSQVGLKAMAEGARTLRRAIALIESNRDEVVLLGEAKFALARTELSHSKERAAALASEALALLRSTPEGARAAVEVETWLHVLATNARELSMR